MHASVAVCSATSTGFHSGNRYNAPAGRVAPLGKQATEHRRVLVVRPRRHVMIADEQRREPGVACRARLLDHVLRADPHVGDVECAGNRDADPHVCLREMSLVNSRSVRRRERSSTVRLVRQARQFRIRRRAQTVRNQPVAVHQELAHHRFIVEQITQPDADRLPTSLRTECARSDTRTGSLPHCCAARRRSRAP